MRGFFYAVLLCILSGCTTPQTQPPPCPPAPGHDTPCRPFRAGMLKLDPELDAVKPVAPFDAAGWVLSSDILVGAVNENLVAGISLKTRKVVWWMEIKEGVATPVSLFGSWVVIGLRDGTVIKAESLTGKKVWEAKLGRFVLAPFSLNGNSLLGLTAGQQLFSLDFQTGATNWVYDAGTPASSLVIRNLAAPVVHEKKVYLGTSAGELHVINLEDGSAAWKLNPIVSESRFNDVVGEIVVDPERVILSRYDGHVVAIGTQGLDRRVLWKEDFPGVTTGAFRDSVYYVGTLNGEIAAIDGITGRKKWQTMAGQPFTSITVGEKVIYGAGTSGLIVALDKANGQLLWHDDVDGIMTRHPLIFNDFILFATGSKVLYSYKLI